jgi:hypothetical protein
VKEVSVVGQFLKEQAHLIEKISQFTDIRKNPQIKLNHIVLSVMLMPFYSVTSLLGLDRLSRKNQFKKLFGCTRKMVASDSTVNRALRWLDTEEVEELQSSFLPLLEQQHLSKIQLAPDRPSRRIGILDGSQMGQHHVVAFDLCGKIDYPLMVSNAHSRGKELPVARQIVENAAQVLKDRFPQLFLLDSLYFNQPFFDCIRSKGAHLLIKSDEPSFREVLVDAKFVFENKNDLVVPVEEKHGFDEFRVCSWRIEKTSGVFAGYPIQIAHLLEDYPKRKKNQHLECWIVTTDLTLLPEEIREAAHLRWHIENNDFKRLSHHTATKRFYFKDPKPFFTMLRLFCTAIALLGILLQILKQNAGEYKRILNGIKETWKNVFSQLEETFQPNIFI